MRTLETADVLRNGRWKNLKFLFSPEWHNEGHQFCDIGLILILKCQYSGHGDFFSFKTCVKKSAIAHNYSLR